MKAELVIVDYGMGNLRSVQKKFDLLRVPALISSDPDVVARARKLVLPGVGHFGAGVRKLKSGGLWEVLNQKVLVESTPILGICLGMQLMASHSEEGDAEGFNWFDAEVVKFAVSDKLTYKIPHMGWNSAELVNSSPLLANLPPSAQFYFVHSYHMQCRNSQDVLATTCYDYDFVSVVGRDNIFGTQFHPEKSHDWGERLIANFLTVPEPIQNYK